MSPAGRAPGPLQWQAVQVEVLERMAPRTSWYALIVLATAACGRGDADAELVALVERAEAAVEARDAGFFSDVVADSYSDAHGRTKEELLRLIRGYFFVNRDIEVVNRIAAVEPQGRDAAIVRLQTGVVTRGRGGALLGLDGELRRLELELIRDGREWRVIGAEWARTSP